MRGRYPFVKAESTHTQNGREVVCWPEPAGGDVALVLDRGVAAEWWEICVILRALSESKRHAAEEGGGVLRGRSGRRTCLGPFSLVVRDWLERDWGGWLVGGRKEFWGG